MPTAIRRRLARAARHSTPPPRQQRLRLMAVTASVMSVTALLIAVVIVTATRPALSAPSRSSAPTAQLPATQPYATLTDDDAASAPPPRTQPALAEVAPAPSREDDSAREPAPEETVEAPVPTPPTPTPTPTPTPAPAPVDLDELLAAALAPSDWLGYQISDTSAAQQFLLRVAANPNAAVTTQRLTQAAVIALLQGDPARAFDLVADLPTDAANTLHRVAARHAADSELSRMAVVEMEQIPAAQRTPGDQALLAGALARLGDAAGARQALLDLPAPSVSGVDCIHLGFALLELGRVDDALAVFARAPTPENTDDSGYAFHYGLSRAIVDSLSGRAAAARTQLDALLQQRPDSYETEYWIARSLEFAGRLDAAAAAYERLTDEAPQRPLAQRRLAALLLNTRDAEGARRVAPRALDDTPRSADAWLILAAAQHALGADAALESVEAARSLEPDLAEAHLLAAVIHARRFEAAEARAALETALEYDPLLIAEVRLAPVLARYLPEELSEPGEDSPSDTADEASDVAEDEDASQPPLGP